MIIIHKKPFYRGIILLATFFSLFFFFFSPIITVNGEKLTGLQYSDQVFNELSKGSSNFLEMAEKAAASQAEKRIEVTIPIQNEELEKIQTRLLNNAQASDIKIDNSSKHLSYTVNLGILLAQAASDAKLLYNNEEDRLFAKYSGIDPLEVAKAWWTLLNPTAQQLQIHNRLTESAAVTTVLQRAIEPGNNYFGIPALKISDNILLITAFLLFYIIYTVWYGYAIYEIFSGLGLMASQAEEEIAEE